MRYSRVASRDQHRFRGEAEMLKSEIKEFARLLVRHVRDEAVQSSDAVLQPNATHAIARRWRAAVPEPDALKVVIPDVVDDVLFHLLHAIDEGLLPLKFTSTHGVEVDLTADGRSELAGWYMGTGGFRAMYSEERFVDDFADQAEWPDSGKQ